VSCHSGLPFAVGPGEGRQLSLAGLGTLHKVPSEVTGGRVAIVVPTLPRRQLGAPLHRHAHEDVLAIVLRGTMGALLGADIVVAPPGSYVMQKRQQWHTFWNAGEVELRFIALLIPGGFERCLERLSPVLKTSGLDRPAIECLADEYGIECDLDSIPELCTRFDLSFGHGGTTCSSIS
jgi:quercetin dioxygenase-like cupin family protein